MSLDLTREPPAPPGHIPLPQRRSNSSRTRQTSAKPDRTSSRRFSSALTELRLLSDNHRHLSPHPDSAIGPAPTATNPPPPLLQIRTPGPEPDYPNHTSWGAGSLARGPHQNPYAAGAGASSGADSQSIVKSIVQSTPSASSSPRTTHLFGPAVPASLGRAKYDCFSEKQEGDMPRPSVPPVLRSRHQVGVSVGFRFELQPTADYQYRTKGGIGVRLKSRRTMPSIPALVRPGFQ
jgi:hypothetical protein